MLCAPGRFIPGEGARLPPAAVLQQSQSGGDPGQHLRRGVRRGHQGLATGLCKAMGAALRSAEKAGGGDRRMKGREGMYPPCLLVLGNRFIRRPHVISATYDSKNSVPINSFKEVIFPHVHSYFI